MEDRISGGLQHRHETCCEKGGHHGRQACMVQRWFHRGDVVSRQVDLYVTVCHTSIIVINIDWSDTQTICLDLPIVIYSSGVMTEYNYNILPKYQLEFVGIYDSSYETNPLTSMNFHLKQEPCLTKAEE